MRLLVLPLALIAACNSDDNGNGGNDGNSGGDSANQGGDSGGGDYPPPGDFDSSPIAATDLCARLAAVRCDAEQICCTDSATKYADAASCKTTETANCKNDREPIAVDSRTGYNATTAGTKLGELYALAAVCDPSAGTWAFSDDGFFAVLDGTIASGGDCTPTEILPNLDAAALLACDSGNVCAMTVVVGLPLVVSGVCAAPSASGGACFTDLECDTDLWCDPPNKFLSGGGTCADREVNGTSCADGAECLTLTCTGSTCADATINDAYCLNN
ncbi:MAG: hypothetical protein V3T05_08670 [Myxococcota bacterium]